MEYRHIPTGIVVRSDHELSSALYERMDPSGTAPSGYSPDMTRAELAEVAAMAGVEVPRRATKEQILAALGSAKEG